MLFSSEGDCSLEPKHTLRWACQLGRKHPFEDRRARQWFGRASLLADRRLSLQMLPAVFLRPWRRRSQGTSVSFSVPRVHGQHSHKSAGVDDAERPVCVVRSTGRCHAVFSVLKHCQEGFGPGQVIDGGNFHVRQSVVNHLHEFNLRYLSHIGLRKVLVCQYRTLKASSYQA